MSAEIDRLAALLAAAQEQAKNVDALGPCSLTCTHNAAYVVAIANAGPALLAVARAAEELPRNSLHVGMSSSVLTADLDALRAALAALDAP